jgi:deazaflavin-dependent oxidoreductase (nitroreductase family)
MDDRVRQALQRGQLVDMTTIGRRTGLPRRVELVYHNIGGRLYISGRADPRRKRAWLVNLEANPRLTLHLKGAVRADLPATARVIDDESVRRALLADIGRAWRVADIEPMVRYSPLIEVVPDDLAA